MTIMIAAIAENNTLGKDNQIIWHLPNDFKRFKLITSGHYIIMGRKTFESFPKPLPNRTHIVISRQKNYKPEGCIVVDSMEKALQLCPKEEDRFIIGGAEIYALGLPFTDKIELTRIHHAFEGDAFFPELNKNHWQVVATVFNSIDEKHLYNYSYETLNRI